MSVESESIGWTEYPTSRVGPDWKPSQIVLVDMDDGVEKQDVLVMLETMPEIGLVIVGKNVKNSSSPNLRLVSLNLGQYELEKMIERVCPEVVVTNRNLREIDIGRLRNNNRVENALSPDKNVSHKYVSENLDDLLKPKVIKPSKARTQECSVARWTAAAVGRSRSNMLGNSQLYSEPSERWDRLREPSLSDEKNIGKPSLLKNILDGRDAGVAIFGAGIGLATALEGLSSPQIKYGAKIGTEVVAGLVVAATAIEATVKSERIRELAGKAKKFLGSVMVFGLGVSVGMMVGGVLEMGNELVHAVGEELEFKSGWEVGGGESDQAHALIEEKPEIVRPAEGDMSTESVSTIDVKPEMTWAALTDYFEQQIIEDGGMNWVNDNGTPDTGDDVSKAQVMAHKALIEGGIEEAEDALSAIASTDSYDEYMKLRASGQIYTNVGN